MLVIVLVAELVLMGEVEENRAKVSEEGRNEVDGVNDEDARGEELSVKALEISCA